jgi:DDE superfamily endonuclease
LGKKSKKMNVLLKLPCIVEHYAPQYKDLFSEEGYEHFQRFVSGIIVSDNKTLSGINRLFVKGSPDQSSLNRFMSRQNFDTIELNKRRVGMMQKNPSTALKSGRGVIALDDTLMRHYGTHFEQIYRLYDHVAKNYTYAHNLISLYYSDDETDYPLDHRLWEPPDWSLVAQKMKALGISINENRWQKRQSEASKWHKYMRDRFSDYQYKKPELQELYKTRPVWGLEMLRAFKAQYPDKDLVLSMDNGYTNIEFCKIVDTELHMAYVGSLADQTKVLLSGSQKISLAEFAQNLIQQHKAGETRFYKTTVHFKGQALTYYTYCATHHIVGFGKQRLVISYKNKDFNDTPRFSISNRLHWHASGILRIRRHRWPVETFHQEGKAEGLDKYQMRDFTAIHSHVALVSTAYTMLKSALHDPVLLSTFQQKFDLKELNGTLPFFRRLLSFEAIAALVEFVHLQATNGLDVRTTLKHVLQPLAQ